MICDTHTRTRALAPGGVSLAGGGGQRASQALSSCGSAIQGAKVSDSMPPAAPSHLPALLPSTLQVVTNTFRNSRAP